MKRLALSFLLMASMIAQAADYYGLLTAKMGSDSEEQEKTVTLVQSSGKYTLTIRNVTVENAGATVGIGTVVISDIAGSAGADGYTTLSGSGTTSIQNGDDPTVSTWWGPTLGSAPYVLTGKVKTDDLTFTINITAPLLGTITVSFETLEVYPVKINGVQLTSANSGSTSEDFGGALKAGTVSYYANTNQLFLNNVTIETSGVYPAIEINAESIDLLAYGTNTVKQTAPHDNSGTNTRNALQFKGKYIHIWYGKLNLESESSAALLLNNTHDVEATIEVEGATLSATSNGYYGFAGGIVGSIEVGAQPYNATLKLIKAKVTAKMRSQSNYSAVGGFKEIVLEGTVLRNPEGGTYDNSRGALGGIISNTKIYTGTLEWNKAKSYSLMVAGVEVNEVNKDDLYDYLPLESGSVTYDDETNTLVLKRANMNLTEDNNIINYAGTEELTINISGSNVLRNDYEGVTAAGIITFSPIKIISDNPENNILSVQSNKAALKTYDKDITLDNIRFRFDGEKGIDNEYYSSAPKAVLKANKAWGSFISYRSNSGVNGFADMKLTGCEVSTPDNGYYDTEQYRYLNSNGTLSNSVSIRLKASASAGDVNNDGEVNITDVVGLANYVMGDTPSNFVLGNADVNSDNDVNVTDVVKLANIVMGM
mgnify:CR=1 FL=1